MERSPVVVIGMHRSGTTLVARMLMELGVFMGAKRDRYEESLFHQHVNTQLMLATGATWAYPEALRSVSERHEFCEWAVDMIEKWHRSSAYESFYLGRRIPWKRGEAPAMSGWKDPRNTFTVPFWQTAHRGVRIVHVLRHGLDVANSLADRQRRDARSRRTGRPETRGRVLTGRGLRLKDGVAFGTEDPLKGLELWRTYVEQGRRILETYPGPKCEVRFEDLVESPERGAARMVEALGLEGARLRPGWEDRVAADKERAYAFRKEPAVVERERWEATLARYGYGL